MGESLLPPAILARFRGLSLERIERIEAGWAALTVGTASGEVAAAMLRDLHTLKGDAHVVGFVEVTELCHKLEEILAAADRRRYVVPEELDLVVTMAIRFLAALVRKQAGASAGGLDLVGFLRQVDAVLNDTHAWSQAAAMKPGAALSERPAVDAPERLSEAIRLRLAATATTIYLEALAAFGPSRRRLRAAWLELLAVIEACSTVRLGPVLARHEAATLDLARAQGKSIDLLFEIDDAQVHVDAAEALDIAVLHALRNAVDHGIEPPEERRAAGKPRLGRIWIRGRVIDDAVEVTIEDDGRGIDWEAVRRRGVEMGLLSETSAVAASEPELLELLFWPSFSTREVAGPVSGRGIGLDALRTAVRKAGGGSGRVTLAARAAGGTTASLRIPERRRTLAVHCFEIPGAPLLFAIPSTFALSAEPALEPTAGEPLLDPLAALGLASQPEEESRDREIPRILCFRGAVAVRLWAEGAPWLATAIRFCPTGEDHPVEVVRIEDHEVLLLRPAALRRSQ